MSNRAWRTEIALRESSNSDKPKEASKIPSTEEKTGGKRNIRKKITLDRVS
jgi:hypothetical protein